MHQGTRQSPKGQEGNLPAPITGRITQLARCSVVLIQRWCTACVHSTWAMVCSTVHRGSVTYTCYGSVTLLLSHSTRCKCWGLLARGRGEPQVDVVGGQGHHRSSETLSPSPTPQGMLHVPAAVHTSLHHREYAPALEWVLFESQS